MKKLAIIVPLSLVFAFASVAFAAPPKKGLYTTQLHGTLTSGKDGTLVLKIIPGKGYKWNKNYPAKLELTNTAKVSFSKKFYKKVKGEITGDDKAGKVNIQARGLSAGTGTVEAVMSFSVCNEETCQVLRKRKLQLQVTVK